MNKSLCKAANIGRTMVGDNNLQYAFCNLQFAIILLIITTISLPASAADLTVELKDSQNVAFVGAIQRWDKNGNQRALPDEKAKIEAPAVDATAENDGGDKWMFKNLPAGKYDLVILSKDLLRIEGFQYTPVKEFDPFLVPDASVDDETRDFITDDIKKSPHYENKVVPLYMAGNNKAVRVLVMLVRDKPTSYESESPGAATIRHEIWQYSWNYGGWQKEKRTKVMDRILMHRDQLRKWTWLWDPKIGGIEMKEQPVIVKYEIPNAKPTKPLKGLYPY
jgi:hypothetical protein